MSVQFGKCSFDGKPVDRQEFDRVRPVLAPYGPDGEGTYCTDNIAILYRAFHTTRESRNEVQPHVTASGLIVTWDGRLDNRNEMVSQLRLVTDSSDVAIVAVAYERWGTDAFSKLIGDWSISIWNSTHRSLILAKDFVGIRPLYYSVENGEVRWSTILDPLVLFASHSLKLEEEYIAGWLSFFPDAHLTPYVGIHSVPPSSFVQITKDVQTIRKYWDFDPGKQIRYRTDAEYEEHFRSAFAAAVRRRLRSDHPILAELSGGMDSSSIVCMADTLIAGGESEAPRLDTLSYYDNSEPNWNERPYFTKVEEKRGRPGYHVDIAARQNGGFELSSGRFPATPASSARRDQQFLACLVQTGIRVVLSGTGGDEVTGGVPTPTPELEDLLASAHFIQLAHRLKAWSLNKRAPWFHLLLEALGRFLPPAVIRIPQSRKPAPWVDPEFAKRNQTALKGYESRVRLFGPPPSFQENLLTLDALRRQLACDTLSTEPCYEKRYPYLDRNLLEFLFAIPREQLVRPGQRRSLMRRSLVGIVPDEILQRRRKAFAGRSMRAALLEQCPISEGSSEQLLCSSLGIVDESGFAECLQRFRQEHEFPIVPFMRTIGLELWLRQVRLSKTCDCGQLLDMSRRLETTKKISSQLRNFTKKGGDTYGIQQTGNPADW
jgi:asparagine synthase (glutamine-hydrolysing)